MQNNEFFTDLRQKVFLLKQMTKRNLQSRFRGSMLSWLWSFLIPLLMLGVYTLIFGCFFKSRWGVDIGESPLIFALALFSGITLYNIFGESVSSSASVKSQIKRAIALYFEFVGQNMATVFDDSLISDSGARDAEYRLNQKFRQKDLMLL